MAEQATILDAVISPARHLELVASEVVEQAATLVRSSLGSATAARTKSSPTDVVTHTDLASERLIRNELRIRCPGSNIVGEEYDDQKGENSIGWIVDPIDGTVNFLYDLPVVSVSIAATIEGQVVAGAVADLVRGDVFTASIGEGSRLNGETVVVDGSRSLEQSLVGTGFSYDGSIRATEADILTRLLPACRDIRCMGSAALNLCWVGCGRLDAFYERDIKIYDYAAGALIAAEAGARVELPAANHEDLTVAAVSTVFDQLRAIVTVASERRSQHP
ncbi:MAG: inositol monophosphatase family protein [Acidimicrobiales bacterium]